MAWTGPRRERYGGVNVDDLTNGQNNYEGLQLGLMNNNFSRMNNDTLAAYVGALFNYEATAATYPTYLDSGLLRQDGTKRPAYTGVYKPYPGRA